MIQEIREKVLSKGFWVWTYISSEDVEAENFHRAALGLVQHSFTHSGIQLSMTESYGTLL